MLPAQHDGHKRLYTRRDAILAGIIASLREASLGHPRMQKALRSVMHHWRYGEFPRYLVVNWKSGVSLGADTQSQALAAFSRFFGQGMPSLLIDIEQIERRLG
jgi:hypothetical protein